MKKLIVLLSLITFFCCSQKKEYNIEDLNILQYDSSDNYIKTLVKIPASFNNKIVDINLMENKGNHMVGYI